MGCLTFNNFGESEYMIGVSAKVKLQDTHFSQVKCQVRNFPTGKIR